MVLEASGTGTEVDFVVAVVAIDDAQFNADNSRDSYESPLGSRPFYHEPQQLLDRGNSRLLPFIGFFSLVCPSLR